MCNKEDSIILYPLEHLFTEVEKHIKVAQTLPWKFFT